MLINYHILILMSKPEPEFTSEKYYYMTGWSFIGLLVVLIGINISVLVVIMTRDSIRKGRVRKWDRSLEKKVKMYSSTTDFRMAA
jgi:hypothetical protein